MNGALNWNDLVARQKIFCSSGHTHELSFRRVQLEKLLALVEKNEKEILAALRKDLRKPAFEAYMSEYRFVVDEIKYTLKHFQKWARPRKVRSPYLLWPSKSEIRSEPYGSVLVMSPWNYPFQLLMSPLVGAMAAGNCAVLKPSELAPATEALIVSLVNDNFPEEYLYAVAGGVESCQSLLKEAFDYIFFTGSTEVGRIVMKAAAEHLTPLTLELGGKSPCIVDSHVDIKAAARRIVWAKFYNAGQTCVAPDYVWVHRSIQDRFVEALVEAVRNFWGPDPAQSPDYARIVSEKHFDRLVKLIEPKKIIVGGQSQREDKYIAPTLLNNVEWSDPIMQNEIFGPLLPILSYSDLDHALEEIANRPKPLALYFFSDRKKRQEQVLSKTRSGGASINDCITYLTNPELPFGGVGSSGSGAYHGQFSFDTFSHRKAVLRASLWPDPRVRYAPYTERKMRLARRLP
jgi:aldehyde dehydrogenase (NAD+)